MPNWLRSVLIISLALACPAAGLAQIGRQEVTYDRFKWQVYHAPHFDIYFYPEEEAFLERMVSFSESAYLKLSEDLDHQLSIRVPLIYYKTHPEFQQTNITLQEIPEAVGAFAEPLQSRMVLPIDGPPDKTYKLILHELTHIFEYDILFNNQLGRTFRANPPLWIMGLLDLTMGGPPVSPYQPAGLWREANTMSPAYEQSVGTALYRRSLYTVWKRTAPPPSMMTFDAATREVCTVRRETTSSPLQALVLLNATQFVETARVLAEAMLRDGGDTAATRTTLAFRRLTGRRPTEPEQAVLLDLYDEQRRIFAAAPERAERLVSIGDHSRDDDLDPVEVAAATMVTQTIMNMDASVWKR